jgi:acetyl esterase/lipase
MPRLDPTGRSTNESSVPSGDGSAGPFGIRCRRLAAARAGCLAAIAWPLANADLGVVPDAQRFDGPEVAGTVVDAAGNAQLVAGRPWVYVDRVSQPTMTVYSPKGSNTGAAVVVFPGGGYNVLAIDLEGTEACDWLTSKGITCVLLKYRVPCVKVGPYRDCLTALEDAQRTVGLVRFNAQWNIDPRKIGVLGFSAGGHRVAAISTHFEKRLYPTVDAADNQSCRPDFAVALYPGHLAIPEKNFALNPDIKVTSETPPTFLLQAEDDPTDPVENSLLYYAALRKAGVPAEMHVSVEQDGLHAPYCSAVAFAGDVLVSASVDHFATQGAIYRRPVDGHGPLVAIAGGLPTWIDGIADTGCIATHGSAVALADWKGNLYVSADTGRSWSRQTAGLPPLSSVLIA